MSLFERASDEKKFLIFNEGDSLLSRRDQAQQNWERTNVNQMLRLMQRHQYPFIVTTNLVDTIDPAAVRLFTFDLKFLPFTPQKAADVFRKWFKTEPPTGRSMPRDLTLGDFTKVRNQAAITGIGQDSNALVEALILEVQAKKRQSPVITGFAIQNG
jgi:SpoVK/Ycf46/Vps4 family AAA+-type ATPase